MNIRHSPFILLSIIFLRLSLINHLSLGADTISGNQSLSGNQTIVSSGGNFVLGFFQPVNSTNFYIGMWYKKVPRQTIVWVANRETPISNKYSSELKIINGNLVLLDESQTTVWSTNIKNSPTSSISAVATLRDDGNLVLIDGSSTSTAPFWQSFDFPTHTFLPGSKIGYNKHTNKSQILTSWKNSEDPTQGLFSLELDPNGSQYLIRWNRSRYYWKSGPWNGRIFSLVPEMRLNYIYNFSYISNVNESYFTYSLYDPSIISRLIMDVSGQIKQLTWLDNVGEWNLFWSQPRQQCEVYAYCGMFGICNQIIQPFCNCLTGFVPKLGNDWSLSDFSGGCVRKKSLQCETKSTANAENDRFEVQLHMGLPQAVVNPSIQSIVECQSTCLIQCKCTAYAYGIGGCSIWYGELLNGKQLSEDDGTGETVYIRLAASSAKNTKRLGLVIGSVVGSVAVMVLVIFWRWKTKQGGRNKSFQNRFALPSHTNLLNDDVTTPCESSDVPIFNLESIIAATDGFCAENKLGEGGFGPLTLFGMTCTNDCLSWLSTCILIAFA